MIKITFERDSWDSYTVEYNNDDQMWCVCNGDGSLWSEHKTEDEANLEASRLELKSFIYGKIVDAVSSTVAQCIEDAATQVSADMQKFIAECLQDGKK